MTLRTPAFLDSKTYGFEYLRLLAALALQEGIFGATDYRTTAAAAGGMRVDITAGLAAIQGDSGVAQTGYGQGLYLAVNDATIANAATLAASNATLPRLDQIVLTVTDSSDLGTAGDVATIAVLTGTATSGATLDNRSGAAALPADTIRLADVLVPAASSAVTAGNIRDRRPWARGGSFRFPSAAGDISAPVGSTAVFANRLETAAGNVVEVGLSAQVLAPSTAAFSIYTTVDAAGASGQPIIFGAPPAPAAGAELGYSGRSPLLPSAGSHVYGFSVSVAGAAVTIRANATTNLVMTAREIVAQNVSQ